MYGKKTGNNYLVDRFGRKHNYLRLSITDKCNFACTYCRPDIKHCDTSSDLMNSDEIVELAKAFTEVGIEKIRLTGGEPTIHKDFDNIVKGIGELPVELAITTNGYTLNKHLHTLKSSSVKKLNISLDTLNRDRFQTITQRNAFDRVYANLILAIKSGFDVKLNAVIMRGVNEHELNDFAELSVKYPVTVRFIEFMPFRDNSWNLEKSFSYKEMLEVISQKYNLFKLDKKPEEKAEYYSLPNASGKIGVISSVSQPFCENCNRIRIMADGKLKNCLFGDSEYNLIKAFREGQSLLETIKKALSEKHDHHGGHKPIVNSSDDYLDNRNMYSIGG